MPYVSLAFAGVLLWWLWRTASRFSPAVLAAVTTGFLARALLGVALFFVSWLHLPIARPLQQGDGLWFFAMDATKYMQEAAAVASGGFPAIVALERMPPSAFFVQCLAVGVRLFGDVTSIGLMLNALAFLGACAAIVVTAKVIEAPPNVVTWTIATIALSPSLILWSTQPLKDTLLATLLVLVFLAGLVWQKALQSGRAGLALLAMVAFWIALWSVGGIRWPVALLLWLFTPILMILSIVRAPRRRLAVAAASFAFVLVMFPAIVVGAKWLVPHNMYEASRRVTLHPATWAAFPRALVEDFDATKRAFSAAPGATRIDAGTPAPGAQRIEGRRHRRAAFVASATAMSSARASTAAMSILTMTVPPSLARAVGLFEVSGGRGLWLFDVDTLAFDVVLFGAILSIVRLRHRTETATPMFWYILAAAAALFFMLPDLVTNYGSLFRYRSVVYVSLAVIPLAVQSVRVQQIP